MNEKTKKFKDEIETNKAIDQELNDDQLEEISGGLHNLSPPPFLSKDKKEPQNGGIEILHNLIFPPKI